MKSKEFIKESPAGWGPAGHGDPGFGFRADDNSNNVGDDLIWTEKEWIKIVKTIQRDCKPYLAQAKGAKLYRGMHGISKPMVKKKVRLGSRTPMDMPQDIHNKLNKLFTMKFGAEFRHSLFVTGDAGQAQEYGDLYAVYPIGNLEFIWSKRVTDLYTAWEDYQPYDYLNQDEFDAKMKKALRNFHDKELVTYQETDLHSAIKSGHEIMVRCGSYYAVNFDMMDDLPKEWSDMLK